MRQLAPIHAVEVLLNIEPINEPGQFARVKQLENSSDDELAFEGLL